MSVPQSVADILDRHVTFQLECIDRMYLNVYVTMQCESGVAKFFRSHRGHPFASSALMDPMTKAFVASMEKIGFKALDNGFVCCDDHNRLQTICAELGPDQIDALLRRWPAKLPHPFTAKNRDAGYRYDISILQAEFSLTQILDRPLSGRMLFEEIIRENLDIGRPDMVQLIFDRRVTKRTPGRFRTRVLTDGVIPSLHIDYKNSRIKQYFKQVPEVREVGARTETTINNTRDFSIGKRLCNLPALRQVGFQANRRILEVERLSQDCAVGEEAMLKLNRPVEVSGQRAPALRITDLRVLALWHLLVWFRLLPCGFANRDLRAQLAVLIGQEPHRITQGKMTYDLRRLRLHGMIERIPKTHRYRVTDFGFRAALFFTRTHARLYRPGLAEVLPNAPPVASHLQRHLARIEAEIELRVREAKLAA